MMKLLVITNNPKRASFRQRIEVHLDALKQAGVESIVEKLPTSELARRRLFKSAGDFDAVLLHKKKLNRLDGAWLRKWARRIIYDFDDAIMYDPHRPERDSRPHTAPFHRTVGLADMVIAGNQYLADHAYPYNDNVHVLPTALNVSAYRLDRPASADGKVRLVWIGSRSTLGYLAELKDTLEEVGSNCPDAVLRIICDDFFELSNLAVEKVEWGLDSQYEDLAMCDIGLAPLPDDRFTRGKCGFKILQYAAAGLPTITSPVGVNAEFVRPAVTGLHAITKSQWIGAMTELIRKGELRRRMGEAAATFAGQFDLKVIASEFVRLVISGEGETSERTG